MFSHMDSLPSSVPTPSVGAVYFENSVLETEYCILSSRVPHAYVEIIEQPVSVGARFRYKCEGRSAGCIRGVNSTDKQKTYPTIKIHGYQGAAVVVVSCVTKDGPPYYPHPHNLVGKTCTNGVCYKPIKDPNMICNFANLGIQCVKKKDIKESLSHREALQVDPFGTGFSHHAEPNKINLNALRLCFQVFVPDENGKLCVPLPPVISNPIFDNKTVSDLTIIKLSHYSAPVTGGQEIILLCDQVSKDDIQIIFYEESDNKITWSAQGKFAPHNVHRKAAISLQTPPYKDLLIQCNVECFVQLRRPSDGAVGKPRTFTLFPVKLDPEGMIGKRKKFEVLHLDRILQFSLHTDKNAESAILPRVIKQAVRSKVDYQSRSTSHFQPQLVCKKENEQPSSVVAHSSFIEIAVRQIHDQQTPVTPSASSSCVELYAAGQKVEDILAVAAEQVGINTTQTFCETSNDDVFDKLSSLDLGIEPCDLDVNLSGITLDAFSESSGLSVSSPSIEGKNSNRLPYCDCTKLQDAEN